MADVIVHLPIDGDEVVAEGAGRGRGAGAAKKKKGRDRAGRPAKKPVRRGTRDAGRVVTTAKKKKKIRR